FFGGNVAIRGESSQELTGGINPDPRENSARDIYGCFCVPPQDKMHEHLDSREDVREFSERQPVGAEALTAFVGLGGWFRSELRHAPPNQVTSGDRRAWLRAHMADLDFHPLRRLAYLHGRRW